MCIRHQQNVNLWLRSKHDFELSPKVQSTNINLWNFLVIISTQNYWASKSSPKKLRLIFEHLMRFSFPNLLNGLRLLLTTRLFWVSNIGNPFICKCQTFLSSNSFFGRLSNGISSCCCRMKNHKWILTSSSWIKNLKDFKLNLDINIPRMLLRSACENAEEVYC